jgi:hypothetical protein
MNFIKTPKSNGSFLVPDHSPLENLKEANKNSLFKNIIPNEIEDEENNEELETV